MASASAAIPGDSFFNGHGNDFSPGGHRRLGVCAAVSAVVLVSILAVFDVFIDFGELRWRPLVIDVILRRQPPRPALEQPEVIPIPEPLEPATDSAPRDRLAPAPSQTAEPVEAEPVSPRIAEQGEAEPAATGAAEPAEADRRPVDWQAELERASAEIVRQHAQPASLHPEFDELRRNAAVHYAEPRTGKPPPIWENVETDIYGRTLLRSGPCFRVLDDTNVGNRYAFETFERFTVFCNTGGKSRQKFPWIEEIRSRYVYLQDPEETRAREGSASPAD